MSTRLLTLCAAGLPDRAGTKSHDASFLRNDPTMQAVAGRAGRALASQPTFSRLENAVDWNSIRLLESEGTEWFCRHGKTQGEIILDMDSTEDPTHGQQALSFYNAHYDSYMYHPLLIFEGVTGALLASPPRPGNAMGSPQAIALRPGAPAARALPQALDRAAIRHVILSPGARLRRLRGSSMPSVSGATCVCSSVMGLCEKADLLWECNADGRRVRLYTSFSYQARSWSRSRRVVAKIERTREGMNLRFLVTNRRGRAEDVFGWYEQRGQAENFIKELKNDLEADRLSCAQYRANAFRLQLHALAYNLFVLFRRHVLRGTELARATVGTIRLRLLKIGRGGSVRARCGFILASGWPVATLPTSRSPGRARSSRMTRPTTLVATLSACRARRGSALPVQLHAARDFRQRDGPTSIFTASIATRRHQSRRPRSRSQPIGALCATPAL